MSDQVETNSVNSVNTKRFCRILITKRFCRIR